jgi:hypothetical protein
LHAAAINENHSEGRKQVRHTAIGSTRAGGAGRAMPRFLIALVLCAAEWFVIGQAAISDYLNSFPQALGIVLLVFAFALNLWVGSIISKYIS